MDSDNRNYVGFDDCLLKRNATCLRDKFTEFHDVDTKLADCVAHNKRFQDAFLISINATFEYGNDAVKQIQRGEFDLRKFSDDHRRVMVTFSNAVK